MVGECFSQGRKGEASFSDSSSSSVFDCTMLAWNSLAVFDTTETLFKLSPLFRSETCPRERYQKMTMTMTSTAKAMRKMATEGQEVTTARRSTCSSVEERKAEYVCGRLEIQSLHVFYH